MSAHQTSVPLVPSEPVPPLQRSQPTLSDVTIMMVDDEPMMTDVAQAYLEDAGYTRFVAVHDPLQAMETARAQRPGLILLDLMMPELNGFDLLRLIRLDERLRYTPVIVLTAASDPASKLRALELGATEFLSKPVDASELKIRVRNSLAFKVYQDRLANDDPTRDLYLEAVDETTLRMLERLEPSELLAQIVERAAGLVGVKHGFLYLLEGPETADGQLAVSLHLTSPFGMGEVLPSPYDPYLLSPFFRMRSCSFLTCWYLMFIAFAMRPRFQPSAVR